MFCDGKTVKAPAFGCRKGAGAITSITVGSDNTSTAAPVEVVTVPEVSTYNAVYNFNAQTGVGVWTNTIVVKGVGITSANIEALNSFTEQYLKGQVTLYTGAKFSYEKAYVTVSNVTVGAKVEDGSTWDATIVWKTLDLPTVTDV